MEDYKTIREHHKKIVSFFKVKGHRDQLLEINVKAKNKNHIRLFDYVTSSEYSFQVQKEIADALRFSKSNLTKIKIKLNKALHIFSADKIEPPIQLYFIYDGDDQIGGHLACSEVRADKKNKERKNLICLETGLPNESQIFDPLYVLENMLEEASAKIKNEIQQSRQDDDNEKIEALCVSKGGKKPRTSSRPNLNKYLRDFSGFINEWTQDFKGRDFVFDAVDDFVGVNDRGYFFITGDPGIGKSAIASELVSRGGYIHHFNIRAEGRNKPRQFMENVCSQLILKYRLDYENLPVEKLQDSGILRSLLQEVSGKIKPSEKVLIIIDALDEVDDAMSSGANILYLPMNLPEGIFIIATTRKEKLNLRIDCVQGGYEIDPDSKENREDIGEYLRGKVSSEGICSYIKKQKLTQKSFVEHMKEKSEGNFIYLHYVLSEIETGAYKDLQLNRLPMGLQNYYEYHWHRMRMLSKDISEKNIKVIYCLSETKLPVSLELLAKLSNLSAMFVQRVLNKWMQFMHVIPKEGHKRYCFYHGSFRDFLNRQDIIQAAGVDIRDITEGMSDPFFDSEDD